MKGSVYFFIFFIFFSRKTSVIAYFLGAKFDCWLYAALTLLELEQT